MEPLKLTVSFQSLGRDSVGLDQRAGFSIVSETQVSIPRSGFCWFGLELGLPDAGCTVSFQSLGRDSVGLDEIQQNLGHAELRFQSLGRDSVGLDAIKEMLVKLDFHVSIPRSGFCWFGQAVARAVLVQREVSIPRSGFCWFGPESNPTPAALIEVSIPRSGFCWFGLGALSIIALISCGFNPSVGILLVWTSRLESTITR